MKMHNEVDSGSTMLKPGSLTLLLYPVATASVYNAATLRRYIFANFLVQTVLQSHNHRFTFILIKPTNNSIYRRMTSLRPPWPTQLRGDAQPPICIPDTVETMNDLSRLLKTCPSIDIKYVMRGWKLPLGDLDANSLETFVGLGQAYKRSTTY